MKKKNRILGLLAIILIMLSMMGCKSKEPSEVYIKFSDTQIALLSQDRQKVELQVKVEDEEQEMVFTKSIIIEENKTSKILLCDVTDQEFLGENAKITDVAITARKNAVDVGFIVLMIVAGAMVGMMISIVISSIRKPIKGSGRRF